MKKILTILLAAAALLSIYGCQKQSGTPEVTTTLTEPEITTNPETPEPEVTTTSDDTEKEPEINETPASAFAYVSEGDEITITEFKGGYANVVIPKTINGKNVTKIGREAFYWNAEIISVTIPDTVTSIEDSAFCGCASLESVVLSKNLSSLEGFAFMNCPMLSEITLPEGLQSIGASAFGYCTSLKTINIPKTVTRWDIWAFENTGLETVEIEEGLETLGEGIFAKSNLKEIIIPGSVKEIPSSAFWDCKQLETVTLCEGLTTICDRAFENSGITKIVIPSTVTSVSEYAFIDSTRLTEVRFEGDAPESFKSLDPNFDTLYPDYVPPYTVYYHSDAKGFDSPEWKEFKTETW